MLALDLALQKRDETEAIRLAQQLMESTVATPVQRLKAANLLPSSSDPSQRSSAWSLIQKLGATKDETGIEALVILGRRSAAVQSGKVLVGEGEIIPKPSALADALDANPNARARHLLFAMDLRLLEEPLRKAEMIAAAEARFTKNDDDLEALTAWLYGKGEYRKVLVHLAPEVAAHRRSLFLQSLDAMAAMGEWREVASTINRASFNLDRVTAEIYLARCSRELGEKTGAENHWNAALEAANGNAPQLMLVADYAEKAGNSSIAQKGFLAATEARPDFLTAFQRLLAIAQATGNTDFLNETLARMATQWPGEASVQNDLA